MNLHCQTQENNLFDKIELAWAAGFFDGEGSVGLHKLKTGRKYVSLNTVNTYKPNIERFYKAIGEVGYMGVRKRREKHWKICYYWQTQKDAAKVFNLLKPYLNNEKKNKTEEYFKLEDRRPDLMTRRGEQNGGAKLKEYQVLEILQSNLSQRKLAKLYGVSRGAITGIKYGKNWKHLVTPDEVPFPKQ